jgi:hypothetical protein
MTCGPWRLGAGHALTILQFDHFCGYVGARFYHKFLSVFLVERTEVHFGEPETTSLKEENGRRPIFFIFWPNEVS